MLGRFPSRWIAHARTDFDLAPRARAAHRGFVVRDGAYGLTITIGSVAAPRGRLSIVAGTMRGGDHLYQIAGVVKPTSNHLSAQVTIDLHPGASGNANISGAFTMTMIGTCEAGRLELYGTGPLGLIIELVGTADVAVS